MRVLDVSDCRPGSRVRFRLKSGELIGGELRQFAIDGMWINLGSLGVAARIERFISYRDIAERVVACERQSIIGDAD